MSHSSESIMSYRLVAAIYFSLAILAPISAESAPDTDPCQKITEKKKKQSCIANLLKADCDSRNTAQAKIICRINSLKFPGGLPNDPPATAMWEPGDRGLFGKYAAPPAGLAGSRL